MTSKHTPECDDACLAAAINRMRTPLHESRLSGETARQDARSLAIISEGVARLTAQRAQLLEALRQARVELRAGLRFDAAADVEDAIAAATAPTPGANTVKRYLVFVGHQYYPKGGMGDFVGDADTLEQAYAMVPTPPTEAFEWHHIYDTQERRIVDRGCSQS